MKWRNTLILVIVLVLLGGYVYFFEMKKKEPEVETTPTTAVTIFDMADGDIVQLTVQSEEGRTRVKRTEDGESWQMEEPTQAEADKGRLDSLALRIAKLMASRALTDTAENLADYGLTSPQITATIKLKSEEEENLFIGDQTPNEASYYIQKEGDPAVYIVASTIGHDLERLITEPPEKPTPIPTATDTPVITVPVTIIPPETITATVEPTTTMTAEPTITATAEPTSTEAIAPTVLPGVELPTTERPPTDTATAEPTATEVVEPTPTSTLAPTDTTARPTKTTTAQP